MSSTHHCIRSAIYSASSSLLLDQQELVLSRTKYFSREFLHPLQLFSTLFESALEHREPDPLFPVLRKSTVCVHLVFDFQQVDVTRREFLCVRAHFLLTHRAFRLQVRVVELLKRVGPSLRVLKSIAFPLLLGSCILLYSFVWHASERRNIVLLVESAFLHHLQIQIML